MLYVFFGGQIWELVPQSFLLGSWSKTNGGQQHHEESALHYWEHVRLAQMALIYLLIVYITSIPNWVQTHYPEIKSRTLY